MRRVIFGLIIIGIAAAGLPAVADTYYVVLKDGTWAPAAGTPTVQGETAYVPLRNGLVATIAAKHIDWRKSGIGDQPKGEYAVPGKGLAAEATIGNMPAGVFGDAAGTEERPASPSPSSAPPAPDPSTHQEGRRNAILGKIQAQAEAILSLKHQRGEILHRMSRQWQLNEKAKLRKEADEISQKIQQMQEETDRLLVDLWGTQ